MEYAEELSEKIIKASEEEMEEIEREIEMEMYLQLSPDAKKRIDIIIMEDGAHI